MNDPETISGLAERMHACGIVPELEVFDLGMTDYAKYLRERGVLRPPFVFNLLLGSLGTLAATPLHLALLTQALPEGSTWAGAGIRRFQLPVNALAIASGWHVRVGLEDNLWLDTGEEAACDQSRARSSGSSRSQGPRSARSRLRPARALIGLPARVR